MQSLFPILLTLFLTAFIVQVFFWNFFRPFVLTKLRYQIFAARDRLRNLAIEGKIKPDEAAFRVVDQMCNSHVAALPLVSLGHAILSHPAKELELVVRRDLEIIHQSGPEIQDVFDDVRRAVMGACLVNSPMWFPVIGVFIACRYWSNQARHFGASLDDKVLTEAYELGACPA